jgi:biopolymer transport protein ExbD
MLTGVIKKKEILDIKRAESIHGVESKVLNDETLLSLNQDGKIYVNNILTELENLEKSIEFSNTKLVIDVDKRVKILEFNKLLDKIKELNKKKVFIKVIESNDDI